MVRENSVRSLRVALHSNSRLGHGVVTRWGVEATAAYRRIRRARRLGDHCRAPIHLRARSCTSWACTLKVAHGALAEGGEHGHPPSRRRVRLHGSEKT